MKSLRLNRFDYALTSTLRHYATSSPAYVKDLLMKGAIAFSLKLCFFATRVLLDSRPQTSRSF